METAFVLVPGAGGQAWYWHRVLPLLGQRGFAAVAVDLPTDDDSAGLDAYAEAVLRAAAPWRDVVVVGQSMGGLTAPLVCARRPVQHLVLLNAMIPLPGETGGQWWTATGHVPSTRSWQELFFHDVPSDVVAEAGRRGEPVQSSRPFEDPWPLTAWPDVTTSVLVGTDDRFFPPDFQRRVARERLGLDIELVPGGHLAALSRPLELVERLVARAAPRTPDAGRGGLRADAGGRRA